MLRQLLLCMVIGSTATSSAVAQTYPNYSPETLKALESVNTKEKLEKLLKDTYHVSLSEKWPANFPLPVYTSNLVSQSFSNSTQGRPTAGATLTTNDQPRQVFDFYKSACSRANWKLRVPSAKALAELSKNRETYVLTADQGKQSIYLTCTKNRSTNGTLVTISWQKKS